MFNRLFKLKFNVARVLCHTIIWFFALYMVGLCTNNGFTQTSGDSMLPNIHDGDMLIVHYPFSIDRFDIVAVDVGEKNHYLKRIIGLPGELIIIVDGHIFINGEILEEDFLPSGTMTSAHRWDSCFLANDEYFIIGDNRAISYDSRYFGPVKKHQIKSEIFAVLDWW